MTIARDLYAILEVSSAATAEEIRKAFRKQVMRYHPDKNPGSPTAAKQFAEIEAAYRVLADRKKRAVYDLSRYGSTRPYPPHISIETAEDLQIACNRFSSEFTGMDPFRMNKEWLFTRLTELLSVPNLSLLKQRDNRQLFRQVFTAAQYLPLAQAAEIAGRLGRIAPDDETAKQEIRSFLRRCRQNAYWEKYKIWLALLVALLCCILLLKS